MAEIKVSMLGVSEVTRIGFDGSSVEDFKNEVDIVRTVVSAVVDSV